jgi:hypothetical protein
MYPPNDCIAKSTSARPYEPPQVKALGSVSEMTLQIPKVDGLSDGLALVNHGPLVNASAA